jgi:ligand-binding sensor domain-containing protein
MKPFAKILLLVLAGMGSGAGSLQAQRNEMAIQRLNASDGLAENSVFCMLQDHLGFLWLGTQYGLHKYDGHSFKVYLPNPDDPGSIRSRSFARFQGVFYEDANKNLWIGGDGGLHRYLRDSDRFQHYPLQAGVENLDRYHVRWITGDSAGRLWVSVLERGLYQFDPVREALAPVESVNDLLNSAVDNMRMTDADPAKRGIYETRVTFPAFYYGDTLQYKFAVRRADGSMQWEKAPNSANLPTGARTIILRGGDIDLSPVDFGVPTGSGAGNLTRATGNAARPTTVHFQVNTRRLTPPLAHGDSLRLVGNLLPLNWQGIRPELTSIFCESDSVLWVGVFGNGLLRFNVKTERVTHNFVPTRDLRSISSEYIWTMFRDRQGALWIGTLGGGLNKLVQPVAGSSESPAGGLDRITATFTRYQHDPNDPHGLSGNDINCIDEDANGGLWITVGHGAFFSQLNRFNPHTSQVTRHPIDLSNILVSVLVNRSGLIWAGSWVDGLFKLNPKAFKFPHYTMQPDEPNSFYGKYIMAIDEDRNGNIWLGGQMEGLYRLDRQSGKYTYFKNDSSHPDSLSATMIWDIIEDRNGAIWIGSREGLHKFDPGKKVFKRYQHDRQNLHSLASSFVTSIYEDRSGVLWVGTWNGVLHRFDPKTETFTRYREFEENSDWYSGAGIISIVEDDQGVLWLGTNGDDLLKFNPAIGKLKGFKENSFDASSAAWPLIDRAGRMWIGLYVRGLALFDRKTETVTKIITEADGLLQNTAYGIEEDNHGNLWISSARGLSKYNPERGTFHHYFKEDGLQDNEFRFFAHHKSRSGEMFFGGRYGFNAFYPDSIKDSDYVPPIVFTDLRINNRPVAIGKDSPLRKDIAVAEEITLAYDQNDIAITFAALDFSMPERNLYSFKLENYDDDWHAPSQERTAVYTNLDPGEYVFRAKGTNSDGVWNEAGASLRIVIAPPWYQTAWAYGFYGLLFLAGVVATDRVQRRRLIRQDASASCSANWSRRENLKKLTMRYRPLTNISKPRSSNSSRKRNSPRSASSPPASRTRSRTR